MNILNECAIDDDIIISLWDILSVYHFADCIYINIIGGKYIFRVKSNKTLKTPNWAVFFFFFFFGVVFFNASPDNYTF